MALTRAKKEELLKDVTGIVKDAVSVVFVHAKGLTVAKTDILRRKLRADSSGYKVVKKTLLKKALQESGITGDMPSLENEIAIAYGTDPLAPARNVYESRKGNEETIFLVGGVYENRFVSAEEITALALIPPVQTLRGMFVNIINSPIQRFVIALNQVAGKKTA